MNEQPVSSIIAFRATNFLIDTYAIKYASESLEILGLEMQPMAGRPSGDPALPHDWKRYWGENELRTPQEAALAASDFIDAEGAWWGDDDQYLRLANDLRNAVKEPVGDWWHDWLAYLEMARSYASPGAWTFSD